MEQFYIDRKQAQYLAGVLELWAASSSDDDRLILAQDRDPVLFVQRADAREGDPRVLDLAPDLVRIPR